MDKFVLEYGRHNIDDFYPMAEFVLTGTDNFTTDLAGFNFIAITVNSSQVSLHVQVRRVPTHPAPWKTRLDLSPTRLRLVLSLRLKHASHTRAIINTYGQS